MTDSISHLINQYNHLMSKDDVGSVKKMGLKLPPPSFTYGKSGGKDAEGAKESKLFFTDYKHHHALICHSLDFVEFPSSKR